MLAVRICIRWVCIASAIALLWACGNARPQPNAIRIGVIAPFTGPAAETTGRATREGASLAAQQFNDSGGILINGQPYSVTLIFGDDEGDVDVGLDAAQHLINEEHVIALIGPQASSIAIPVADLAEQRHIPMISPLSTNSATTANKQFVFRIGFIDEVQGDAMARFTRLKLNNQRAAVLYERGNAYNSGLAQIFRDAFSADGGEIVAFVDYAKGTTNFAPYLEPIRDAQPDVLFMPNLSEDSIPQGLQARTMGITATFVGSDAWTGWRTAAHPEFDGSFYSQHWTPELPTQTSQDFVRKYRQHYSRDPLVTSALTYDATTLLLTQIQARQSLDPSVLRAALASTQGFNGVTGPITYNNSGDPRKNVVILKIQQGKATFYQSLNP